jgi:hypothetical protein
LVDEGFDGTADLVADWPDTVEILACGVVEDPVLVAFAGIVGAGVAARHGDHDVGSFDGLRGQGLGSFVAMSIPSSAMASTAMGLILSAGWEAAERTSMWPPDN